MSSSNGDETARRGLRALTGITRRKVVQLSAWGATSSALALAAPTAPTCLRAPYLQNLTPSSATVLWTLPVLIDAVLSVTDSNGVSHTSPASVSEFTPAVTGFTNSFFQYVATVSNLTAGTSYSYSLLYNGRPVPTALDVSLSFQTPGLNQSFKFLHLADSGTGTAAQLQIASLMGQEYPDLVLANGDLAYEFGTWAAVEDNYFGVYRDLMAQVPFFATLGNHEYMTQGGTPSVSACSANASGVPVPPPDRGRYYSFDWGNAHFVALDTNAPLARCDSGDTSMLAWLEKDLRATRKFWRIAVFHHPGYASGIHQDEPEAGRVRQYIVPLLEKYGVQLVLTGHEHNYQRTYPVLGGNVVSPDTGGIVYVTSGGGGKETYMSSPAAWIQKILSVNHFMRSEVSNWTLALSAVAADGTVADSMHLSPQPRIMAAPIEPASSSHRLASGGLVSITGLNLCSLETHPSAPLTQAHGTSVTLEGHAVAIVYADATRVNVQIPASFSGTGLLVLKTPNGSASVNLNVANVAPAMFAMSDGSGHAVTGRTDGSLVSPESPAMAHEVVTFFLTGLGATASSEVRADVKVTIGGVAADVLSARAEGTHAGVYQVRVRVPGALREAVSPVQVFADSVGSNVTLLATGGG